MEVIRKIRQSVPSTLVNAEEVAKVRFWYQKLYNLALLQLATSGYLSTPYRLDWDEVLRGLVEEGYIPCDASGMVSHTPGVLHAAAARATGGAGLHTLAPPMWATLAYTTPHPLWQAAAAAYAGQQRASLASGVTLSHAAVSARSPQYLGVSQPLGGVWWGVLCGVLGVRGEDRFEDGLFLSGTVHKDEVALIPEILRCETYLDGTYGTELSELLHSEVYVAPSINLELELENMLYRHQLKDEFNAGVQGVLDSIDTTVYGADIFGIYTTGIPLSHIIIGDGSEGLFKRTEEYTDSVLINDIGEMVIALDSSTKMFDTNISHREPHYPDDSELTSLYTAYFESTRCYSTGVYGPLVWF